MKPWQPSTTLTFWVILGEFKVRLGPTYIHKSLAGTSSTNMQSKTYRGITPNSVPIHWQCSGTIHLDIPEPLGCLALRDRLHVKELTKFCPMGTLLIFLAHLTSSLCQSLQSVSCIEDNLTGDRDRVGREGGKEVGFVGIVHHSQRREGVTNPPCYVVDLEYEI